MIAFGLTFVCASWWAFRTLPEDDERESSAGLAASDDPLSQSTPAVLADSFDPAVFASTRLWHSLEDAIVNASEDAAQDEPRNPTTLQLIGIVEQDGVPTQAAIYDTKNNELIVAGPEESVGRFVVTSIERDRVTFTDQTREFVITMDPAIRASSGDLAFILKEAGQ